MDILRRGRWSMGRMNLLPLDWSGNRLGNSMIHFVIVGNIKAAKGPLWMWTMLLFYLNICSFAIMAMCLLSGRPFILVRKFKHTQPI